MSAIGWAGRSDPRALSTNYLFCGREMGVLVFFGSVPSICLVTAVVVFFGPISLPSVLGDLPFWLPTRGCLDLTVPCTFSTNLKPVDEVRHHYVSRSAPPFPRDQSAPLLFNRSQPLPPPLFCVMARPLTWCELGLVISFRALGVSSAGSRIFFAHSCASD